MIKNKLSQYSRVACSFLSLVTTSNQDVRTAGRAGDRQYANAPHRLIFRSDVMSGTDETELNRIREAYGDLMNEEEKEYFPTALMKSTHSFL